MDAPSENGLNRMLYSIWPFALISFMEANTSLEMLQINIDQIINFIKIVVAFFC